MSNGPGAPSERGRTSKPKSKSKSKRKLCKTCGQDILSNEMRGMFIYKDTYHQLKAKEYCKKHEDSHSGHKCKPSWCGDCGFLMKYEIEIQKR